MSVLRGSMVAIVTPMLGEPSVSNPIDFESLKNLIDFHVEEGTKAIVAAGTTGESATLTHDEHCLVIKKSVEYSAGRIPVIAGTGANSTHEALRLTEEAAKLGATAVLIVTPYYNKPTQNGLFDHHKVIAEKVDIPQILYNVPARTACDMLPETVIKLARIPNIIGIKEATGDLNRLAEIKRGCRTDFLLLSGDDETSKDFMLKGGDGVISVVANVAPKDMSQLCDAALEGDIGKANEIDARLSRLHKDLFLESNPIPVKKALHDLNLIKAGIRLPLTNLDDRYHQKLKEAMQSARLL